MFCISTARIAPAEDGTFSYSPKGSLALTLAVEDVSGDIADHCWVFQELTSLVAAPWRPDANPRRTGGQARW